MKDVKGTKLKISDRVCIQEDIPTIDGMLYKNTIVKVDSLEESKLRVQDRSGKLWWVKYSQVSEFFIMGYDMEMDDFHDEEEFNRKELERLKKEILEEAKKVVNNYVDNPSDISGSVVNIHQNSPFLDQMKMMNQCLVVVVGQK